MVRRKGRHAPLRPEKIRRLAPKILKRHHPPDDVRPLTGFRLADQPQRRIPGCVLALGHPDAERQRVEQHPRRHAERPNKGASRCSHSKTTLAPASIRSGPWRRNGHRCRPFVRPIPGPSCRPPACRSTVAVGTGGLPTGSPGTATATGIPASPHPGARPATTRATGCGAPRRIRG